MEDVVEAIVVAEVAVVVDEDDVGDVVVEVVLGPLVVEELAMDVDKCIGSVAADVDLDTSAGGGVGVRKGGSPGGGPGGGTDERVEVDVDVVFKEDVLLVDVVFFVEDVAEFCLFECDFFAKKSCVVFSSATVMRRFKIIGQTD